MINSATSGAMAEGRGDEKEKKQEEMRMGWARESGEVANLLGRPHVAPWPASSG